MRAYLFLLLFVPITLSAQTQQPREKWEYAEFDIIGGPPGLNVAAWIAGDSISGFRTMEDAARAFGLQKPSLHAMLNAAGADGWELVAVDHLGTSTKYYFKRRRSQ